MRRLAAIVVALGFASCQFDGRPHGITNIRCVDDGRDQCGALGLTCKAGFCAADNAPFVLSLDVAQPVVSPEAVVLAEVTADRALDELLIDVILHAPGAPNLVTAAARFDRLDGGLYSLQLPPTVSAGTMEITALGRDDAGNLDFATRTLRIDDVAPVASLFNVEITPPDAGPFSNRLPPPRAITLGSTLALTWVTAEDARVASLSFSTDGGVVVLPITVTSTVGRLHRASGTVPLDGGALPQGALDVEVVMRDIASNTATQVFSGALAIDTIAPVSSAEAKLLRSLYTGGTPGVIEFAPNQISEAVTVLAYDATTIDVSVLAAAPYTPQLGARFEVPGRVEFATFDFFDDAWNKAGERAAVRDVVLSVSPNARPDAEQFLERRPNFGQRRMRDLPTRAPEGLADGGLDLASAGVWRPLGERNAVNTGSLLAFDADRGRVMAWSAWARGSTPLDRPGEQLSEFLGGGWSTTNTGPALGNPAWFDLVFDPFEDQLVRFDGETRETWAWAPKIGVWQLLTSAAGGEPAPSTRASFTLAWDRARQAVVLFGGTTAGTASAELWTLSLGLWRQESLSNPPPPRFNAGLAWINGIGLLLVGGRGASGALNDAWVLEGSRWVPFPALPQPMVRPILLSSPDVAWPAWCIDAETGETWRLSASRVWINDTPAPWRISDAIIDATNGELIATATHVNETARRPLDAGAPWVIMPAGQPEAELRGPTLAVDSSGATLLHGGQNTIFQSTTWCRSGRTGWQRITAGPPARADAAMVAFDGGVVLTGGTNGTPLADRWLFTPQPDCLGTWQSSGSSSAARFGHQGALTPTAAHFLAGTPSDTLESFINGGWTARTVSPPIQRWGAVGYDPQSGVLRSLGNSSFESADGINWGQSAPELRLPREEARAVVDGRLNRLVVIGGEADGGVVVPVAVVDGARVMFPPVDASEKGGPRLQLRPALAFNPATGTTLAWNGGQGQRPFWELALADQRPALIYHLSLDELITTPARVQFTALHVEAIAGGSGTEEGVELLLFEEGRFVPLSGQNVAPATRPAPVIAELADPVELALALTGQRWLTVAVTPRGRSTLQPARLRLDQLEVSVEYRYVR